MVTTTARQPIAALRASLDRRTFLKLVSMAGTGMLAGADDPVPVRAATGRRVVVLGGGLAGLASAWNLMHHGYDVVVLEAQAIPGGRVKTIRDPFTQGGYAEVGAVRIQHNHHWTRKYIALMDLESKLMTYDEGSGPRASLWSLQGRQFVTPRGAWPLDGLTPHEQANPFAMMPTYIGAAINAVGDPSRPDFPTEATRAIDIFRFGDYIKTLGASEAWMNILYATEGELGAMNALAVTAFLAAPRDGPSMTTYGLAGGNDQLPKAIAATLGARIKYETQVLTIAHETGGVVITVRDKTGQHAIAGDHCICTLPFPLLRDVVITPAFSDRKMEAIRRYGLYAAARAVFQTRTQFWRHDPRGSLDGLQIVGTDTVAGRIWNTSRLQPDPTLGMLHSYMLDEHAIAFARTPPAERLTTWIDVIAQTLPGIRDEVVASYSKVWHEDPWQKGAFAFLQPNDFRWAWPAARRAEGRVHFAGEHTSLWPGWQNGALESAERCVQEVLEAPR
jgi:monoamine oxidase